MNTANNPEATDYLDLINRAYEMGRRDTDQEWFRVVGSAEQKHYGPGGREHFADAREGDYTGGPVIWEPGEQKEPEAGS